MIMIKNVYFCVAKAKIDDPDGHFWIILLGTDRLEVLYGILRTMVGNDANLDILQLGLRLRGTAEVSTILAKYPHWDRAPQRLKLPALSKDQLVVHDHVDHINPASWRGDVRVSQVNLQTCWRLGRMEVEKEFPRFAHTFHDAIEVSRDIFSPLGVDLVKTAQAPDDHDDTLDSVDMPAVVEVALGPDIENAITEDSPSGGHDPCFELDGKQIYKARFLNQAFMHFRKTGSTDRLKRVANIQRYAAKPTTTFGGVLDYDPLSSGYQIQIDSLIASLVRCDGSVFLCIGEVNDIVIDSQHTEQVDVNILMEPTVSISYQLLLYTSYHLERETILILGMIGGGQGGEGLHTVSPVVSFNQSTQVLQ
jgi:hypothetical protein